MNLKEWLAENYLYKICGCAYNKSHDHIFFFIKSKIPAEFIDKEISDLGCGDGGNTIRIRQIFKPKRLTAYDHNESLLKMARDKGLSVKMFDMNGNLPKGEMATFTFSLHHAHNAAKTLEKAKENFKYIFICEPCLNFYHKLLDAGKPLPRQKWIELFNRVLKKYTLYEYKNNVIVFYKNPIN